MLRESEAAKSVVRRALTSPTEDLDAKIEEILTRLDVVLLNRLTKAVALAKANQN